MKTIRSLLPGVLLLACSAPCADLHLGQTLAQWKKQLEAPERTDRLLASRAIGEMAIAGVRGADKALFAAIGHKDSAVRYWAVVATGQMGERGKAGVSRLRRALRDPAPEVRCWAAYASVQLGEADRAMPVLIEDLGNEERGARLQAAHALDALGEKARPATEALKKALDDEFDYVKRTARHALWVLGERSCPYQKCEAE